MKTATLDRPIEQPATLSLTATAAPTMHDNGPTTASVSKSGVLVGLCFLTATFTFAIGNALIRLYFSSAPLHDGTLVAGAFLLGCCAFAAAANGVAMRRILKPQTPIGSQAYFVLRVAECLTLVAVGVYFLTSHTQWDAYVLAVYTVSGTAGLVLSSGLMTSKIVPRNLCMLGLVGYPIFLVGTTLAMFNLIDVTHGAGMLALVPGGLFELILPIWLFTKGFTSQQSEA